MTSFRAHPLELVLMASGSLVATGALIAVFNGLLQTQVTFYSFLGVHALLFVSNLLGNLRHSPVWISYGPTWGRWLISPAHHQLHHSCDPTHIGCNRGFELAIWDRLYGTLYVPQAEPVQLTLGLGDGSEARYHNVGRMYLLPFVDVARRIGSRAGRLSVR
jgi:sterol desaturase/sphingolipid hydroxylase (fatty acid hydroxylase superfamily)